MINFGQKFLFNEKGDFFEFLERRKAEIRNKVSQYDSGTILNKDEEICEAIISEYSLKPPVLKKDKTKIVSKRDVNIPTAGFVVKQFQITIGIPFDGDGELFHYRPSKFSLPFPCGEVEKNEIRITFTTPEDQVDWARQELFRNTEQIEKFLDYLKEDIEKFDRELPIFVRQLVKERKQSLSKLESFIRSLGIPEK